jgi:hypothetical protein
MSKQLFIASAVAGVLTMGSYPALPAPPGAGAPMEQAGQQQPIYGSQLMTPAARAEYRAKMASLKTQEQRDALRAQHHKQMQERAQQMGVALPEVPPASGGPAAGEHHAKMQQRAEAQGKALAPGPAAGYGYRGYGYGHPGYGYGYYRGMGPAYGMMGPGGGGMMGTGGGMMGPGAGGMMGPGAGMMGPGGTMGRGQ